MSTTGTKQSPANTSDLANKVAEEVRRTVDSAYDEVQRNVRRARRAAEDVIEDGRYEIKRRPFSYVGIAALTGLVIGVAVGWWLGNSND
jgi:ElaB/YqjD/DUF883 family membrane-anchored ribosome-binding protein